jgi:transcriptional regulator with XRE-family HTH domain
MLNTKQTPIGSRLREVREAIGKSQAGFANCLGVSLRAYSNYENGKTQPDAILLQTMCAEFDINPAWLLLGEGPMRRSESEGVKQPTQPAPQAEGEPFDWEVHKMVIVELQRYLDLRKGRLEPNDYAEAVKLLYEIAIEDVEKSEDHQPDRRKVAKIIEFSRLVA